MRKPPEIVLPEGTWYVLAGRIPDLIATALHPAPPKNAPKRIILALIYTRPVGTSMEFVSSEDQAVLDKIFATLPPLKLPISEEDWPPYAQAFAKGRRALKLRWDLDCLISNPSENAEMLRQIAKKEHTRRLRTYISKGTLEQLSPGTQIPTSSYFAGGIVKIDAFTDYVKQSGINVTFEKPVENELSTQAGTESQGEHSKPVSAREIRNAFKIPKVKDSDKWWRDRMAKASTYGLLDSRAAKGKGRIQSQWYPELIAGWLAQMKHLDDKQVANILRKRFPQCVDTADRLDPAGITPPR